jgi:hypothetical protein
MKEANEDYKQFAYDAQEKTPCFSPAQRIIVFFKEIVMTRKNPSNIIEEIKYGVEGDMTILSDFHKEALPINLNGFLYFDTEEDLAVILYLDGEIAICDTKHPKLRVDCFYGTTNRIIMSNQGTTKIVKPNYYCDCLEEEQSKDILYEEKYEYKERFYEIEIEYIKEHPSVRMVKNVNAMKQHNEDDAEKKEMEEIRDNHINCMKQHNEDDAAEEKKKREDMSMDRFESRCENDQSLIV